MTRRKVPTPTESTAKPRPNRSILKLIIRRKPDPNRKSVEQLLYELRHGA